MAKVKNALALEAQGIIHLSNSSGQNYAFRKATIASNQVGLRLPARLSFCLTFTIKGLHIDSSLSPQTGETEVLTWTQSQSGKGQKLEFKLLMFLK